jgi:hypothetical protein
MFAKKTSIYGMASPDPLLGPAAIPSREPLRAANLEISIGTRQKAAPRWKIRASTDGLGERALRYIPLGQPASRLALFRRAMAILAMLDHGQDARATPPCRPQGRQVTITVRDFLTAGPSLDNEGRHGLSKPVREGREDWR